METLQRKYQPMRNLKLPLIYYSARSYLSIKPIPFWHFDVVWKGNHCVIFYQNLLRYKGIPLEHQVKCQKTLICTWLMQEPPVVNPDGLGELRPSIESRLWVIQRTLCFVKWQEDNFLSFRRIKSASNIFSLRIWKCYFDKKELRISYFSLKSTLCLYHYETKLKHMVFLTIQQRSFCMDH